MLTADVDGGLELEEVGLGEEDLLGGDAEVPDLGLGQLHLLPRHLVLLPVQQPPYELLHRAPVHRAHAYLPPATYEPLVLGPGPTSRQAALPSWPRHRGEGDDADEGGGGHGREGRASERNPRVGLCSLGFRSMPSKRLASDDLPNRDGWRK